MKYADNDLLIMSPKRKQHAQRKSKLHPRNKHQERYDFRELVKSCPELAQFVGVNNYNDESIDFFNPIAVKVLNESLLKHYYSIEYWNVPDNYLCPPIPGRADYIHYIADVLGKKNKGKIPTGKKIKCLDIGIGANTIYPIIGVKEYGWSFIGSDINQTSIESACNIIMQNTLLKKQVEVRKQKNNGNIFLGVVQKTESIDLSICNPPFHASATEANEATIRKLNNLKKQKTRKAELNFGGRHNELWCKGGEIRFVTEMIEQSKFFSDTIFWFSTLISKQSNLKKVLERLTKVNANDVKVIEMEQGNKKSRIVAWTFFTREQGEEWVKNRWGEK